MKNLFKNATFILLPLFCIVVNADGLQKSCPDKIDPMADPDAYVDALIRPRIDETTKPVATLSSMNEEESKQAEARADMQIDIDRARPFEALSHSEIMELYWKLVQYECGQIDSNEYFKAATKLSEIRPQLKVQKVFEVLQDLPNYNLQNYGGNKVTNAAYLAFCSICQGECFGGDVCGSNVDKVDFPGCAWAPSNGYSADTYTYQFFWWFVGRKYSKEIFEDWYSCWKVENSKDKPREIVIRRLCDDIYKILHIVMPEFARTIEEGDKSLLQALAYMDHVYVIPGFNSYACEDRASFLLWWSMNKGLYNENDVKNGTSKALKCEQAYRILFDSVSPCKSSEKELTSMIKDCTTYYSETASQRKHLYWYYQLSEFDFESVAELGTEIVKIARSISDNKQDY